MIRQRSLVLLCALLSLLVAGCARTEVTPSSGTHSESANSIGIAWLESDGTLVMQLRAEGSGKSVGDALLRYRPGDPDYEKMLRHVGGLKPGETKQVPPFPQK